MKLLKFATTEKDIKKRMVCIMANEVVETANNAVEVVNEKPAFVLSNAGDRIIKISIKCRKNLTALKV